MSSLRLVILTCDFLTCDAETDTAEPTVAEARKTAARFGWLHVNHKDYCPTHAKTRS